MLTREQILEELQKSETYFRNLNAEGVNIISEDLKTNKTLTDLDLGVNKLGAEGVRPIAEALKINKTLTNLGLGVNRLGAEGVRPIAEALKINKTLTYLGLSGNQIDVDGAKAIAEALKTNKTLTALDLGANGIGVDGTKAIAEALKTNNTLTTLNLNLNGIPVDGTKAIAKALETNKTLTSLGLGGIQIDVDGAKAIAEALKINKTLTTLDLGYSNLGDGTKAIAEALKTNTTLTTLYLNSNQIGVDGAKAIAEALEINKTLTDLDLDGNDIGDEGAKAIAEVLKTNKTLTALNLPGNQIDIDGAKAIAEALKINNTLTDLDLRGNEIGDEGEKAIVEALERNTSLLVLKMNFRNKKLKDKVNTLLNRNKKISLLTIGKFTRDVWMEVNGKNPLKDSFFPLWNLKMQSEVLDMLGINLPKEDRPHFKSSLPADKASSTISSRNLAAAETKETEESLKQSYESLKKEFFDGVAAGDLNKVQACLNAGMDVNTIQPTTGETALHRVFNKDYPKDKILSMAILLLKNEAYCGVRNLRGQSPLHYAAEQGYDLLALIEPHDKSLARFIETQWRKDKQQGGQQDFQGRTPADIYKSSTAKLLTSEPLKLPPIKAQNKTPLQRAFFEAVRDRNLEKVQEFLNQGIDINSVDAAGTSALHHFFSSPIEGDAASIEKAEKLLSYLLQAGAYLGICDPAGRSPLHTAASQQYDFLQFYEKNLPSSEFPNIKLQWENQKDQDGKSPADLFRFAEENVPKRKP